MNKNIVSIFENNQQDPLTFTKKKLLPTFITLAFRGRNDLDHGTEA
jgi:hypothetical protein